MYLNYYPATSRTQKELTISESFTHELYEAFGVLQSIINGYPSSCSIEEARSLLATLEDGEALAAFGYTDPDQEWVEVLHADIKAAMNNANA